MAVNLSSIQQYRYNQILDAVAQAGQGGVTCTSLRQFLGLSSDTYVRELCDAMVGLGWLVGSQEIVQSGRYLREATVYRVVQHE